VMVSPLPAMMMAARSGCCAWRCPAYMLSPRPVRDAGLADDAKRGLRGWSARLRASDAASRPGPLRGHRLRCRGVRREQPEVDRARHRGIAGAVRVQLVAAAADGAV